MIVDVRIVVLDVAFAVILTVVTFITERIFWPVASLKFCRWSERLSRFLWLWIMLISRGWLDSGILTRSQRRVQAWTRKGSWSSCSCFEKPFRGRNSSRGSYRRLVAVV
jgi:hypothetical protein